MPYGSDPFSSSGWGTTFGSTTTTSPWGPTQPARLSALEMLQKMLEDQRQGYKNEPSPEEKKKWRRSAIAESLAAIGAGISHGDVAGGFAQGTGILSQSMDRRLQDWRDQQDREQQDKIRQIQMMGQVEDLQRQKDEEERKRKELDQQESSREPAISAAMKALNMSREEAEFAYSNNPGSLADQIARHSAAAAKPVEWKPQGTGYTRNAQGISVQGVRWVNPATQEVKIIAPDDATQDPNIGIRAEHLRLSQERERRISAPKDPADKLAGPTRTAYAQANRTVNSTLKEVFGPSVDEWGRPVEKPPILLATMPIDGVNLRFEPDPNSPDGQSGKLVGVNSGVAARVVNGQVTIGKATAGIAEDWKLALRDSLVKAGVGSRVGTVPTNTVVTGSTQIDPKNNPLLSGSKPKARGTIDGRPQETDSTAGGQDARTASDAQYKGAAKKAEEMAKDDAKGQSLTGTEMVEFVKKMTQMHYAGILAMNGWTFKPL